MKKVLLISVVLCLAALFGWQVFRKLTQVAKGPGGPPPQRAIAVEVAPVQSGVIRDVGQFTGSLLPRSQFVVAPKVSGRLEKLLIDIGDTVRRDQLIAVLGSQEYVLEVEQARAELKVAKANVAEYESSQNVAKRELERVTALREKQIASESRLDEAEASYKAWDAKYKVSLAQVEQREVALKTAEVRLSYTQIRASWENGGDTRVVGERYVDEGSMLHANDPIVSILDLDALTAVIYVTEEQHSKVRVGQSVVLTSRAFAGQQFLGTVARMAPALKEASRAARIEVQVPNPEHRLKPGMFVRAEIELARHDGATLVPLSAVTKRDGNQGVFLLDQNDMKAWFVPVETGIVTAELAEIVQPALEGSVVTIGHHLLENGASVILPGTNRESEAAEGASPRISPSGPPSGGKL